MMSKRGDHIARTSQGKASETGKVELVLIMASWEIVFGKGNSYSKGQVQPSEKTSTLQHDKKVEDEVSQPCSRAYGRDPRLAVKRNYDVTTAS
jgi:hypothetical protein